MILGLENSKFIFKEFHKEDYPLRDITNNYLSSLWEFFCNIMKYFLIHILYEFTDKIWIENMNDNDISVPNSRISLRLGFNCWNPGKEQEI